MKLCMKMQLLLGKVKLCVLLYCVMNELAINLNIYQQAFTGEMYLFHLNYFQNTVFIFTQKYCIQFCCASFSIKILSNI